MMSGYSSKLSPEIKRYLSDLKAGENPVISIIIRTGKEFKKEQITQLEVIGAEIRTTAGNIVTLTLPARELSTLAAKDFVTYVEITRPLFLE